MSDENLKSNCTSPKKNVKATNTLNNIKKINHGTKRLTEKLNLSSNIVAVQWVKLIRLVTLNWKWK